MRLRLAEDLSSDMAEGDAVAGPDTSEPRTGHPSTPSAAPEADQGRETATVRQLRLSQRVVVSIKALLTIDGAIEPITITNVSQTGFGYIGAGGSPRGTPITIDLPDGRTLAAHVMWWSVGRGGCRLLEPLAIDDPLLGGAGGLPERLWENETSTLPDAGRARSSDVSGNAMSMWLVAGWRLLLAGLLRQPRQRSQGLQQSHVRRTRAPIPRSIPVERACRKQGFSWLVDGHDSKRTVKQSRCSSSR